MIRIPPGASPEIQEAFRQLDEELRKVTGTQNFDMRGRRIINAGQATAGSDYVTLADLKRLGLVTKDVVPSAQTGTFIGPSPVDTPPVVIPPVVTPPVTPPVVVPPVVTPPVGGGGGTTPPVVIPPVPVATFSANPLTIPAIGGTTTLTWTSTNATSAKLSNIAGTSIEVLPLSGTKVITIPSTNWPLGDSIFVIAFIGPGGTISKQVSVTLDSVIVVPPIIVVPQAGALKASGQGFTYNGAPFDVLGFTAFTLFHLWVHTYGNGRAFAMHQIETAIAKGMRSPRVACTLHRNSGWGDGTLVGAVVQLDPAIQTDLFVQLRAFATAMRDAGIAPYYVVFGDVTDGVMNQAAVRTEVCKQVAAVLRDFPCIVEVSNEPESTGMELENGVPTYDPFDEAQRLAYVYKTIDKNNPVATCGGYFASQMDREPADWMGYQSERLLGNGGWEWVYNQLTASAVRANGLPRAIVNGEPINAEGGGGGSTDSDPVHWWAFGIVARLLKMGVIFHSHILLNSYLQHSSLEPMLQAFIDGTNRISSRMPGTEFAVFSTGAVYGSSPWAANTAFVVYGRHNGISGKAIAMITPGGWSVSASLNPGWTATIVETRSDASLIDIRLG